MAFSLHAYQLKESRVFRDPIHGYVRMYYAPFWDIVNTKEMQRLRRIHQLGGTHMVYQCAEHSRFTHSLGVYEIVRRILKLEPFEGLIDDYDYLTVLLAALLHDVGHGPFSHCFEHVSKVNHEQMTQKIILDPHTEVHQVLSAIDDHLCEAVAAVIAKKHPNALLVQMVSSQIDGDRMDYLLRDSYFTGTTYGRFDIERILRTIRVHDGRIVIKASGIQAVENYILARYHMYWQVYFHPVTRSHEQLLIAIFERMIDLVKVGFDFTTITPFLAPFLKQEEVSVTDYLKLNENSLMYYFELLSYQSSDAVLSDLCSRFLDRRLFAYSDWVQDEIYEKILSKVQQQGLIPKYYLLADNAYTSPYKSYDAGHEVEEIHILMLDGTIRKLPEVSEIVQAIINGHDGKHDRKLYFPREIAESF